MVGVLGGDRSGNGWVSSSRAAAEHYRVAQLLDRRLQLADSLSTAWYLLSSNAKRQDAIAEYQLKGAERAAGRVDVAQAFPVLPAENCGRSPAPWRWWRRACSAFVTW